MEKERRISLKNYYILAGIIIISIVFTIYLYMWYRTYENEVFSSSIISNYLTVINYSELDNYLIENKDAVIYVSVSNKEMIRNFEKQFKKVINKYSLNNSILYLNISSELENGNLSNEINEQFGIDVPYIVVFKDGAIKSKFNIKDNKYDIDLLIDYLMSEGVIND